MGLLIDIDDFVGRCEVSKNNFTESKLNKYISLYEEQTLIKLLGNELFLLFKANVVLNGNQQPSAGRFLTIYDPITNDEEENNPEASLGMKQLVLGVVYYKYKRDEYIATISGQKKGKSETSLDVTFDQWNLDGRWNESVRAAKSIQKYINDNDDTYPEYNGSETTWCKNGYFSITHWSS